MIYRSRFWVTIPICLGCIDMVAQETLTTDITFNCSGGSGDFTAYYLTANQHGAWSTDENTYGMRASVYGTNKMDDWLFDYGVDVIAQTDKYTPFYLQQLFARAQWRDFYIEIGAREYDSALRNQRLSSGSLLWSGNSHPVPQLRLGTNGFYTIPGTNGWLQTMFDGGYGLYMDGDFLETRYDEYNPNRQLQGYAQSYLTTGAWQHQKRFFLRSNPNKTVALTLGLEHAVQFGGKTENYINNTINGVLEQKVGFGDWLSVFVPSGGDSDAAVGDQNFIYGNHLGDVHVMLDWNIDKENRISFYLENLFEDGSGFCKRNGWDGLWGIEYKSYYFKYVTGFVFEYLQTTDQSGAVHWAPQDHLGELSGQARGADEYYNNYFYNGYAHFGQSMGSPMLKSPIYNQDSYLRFTDNRIQAWHAGVEGIIYEQSENKDSQAAKIGYRSLLSYRNSYGTMNIPSRHIRHDFSFLTELNLNINTWQMALSYAQDNGSLMGDNYSFNISLKYHGKLL